MYESWIVVGSEVALALYPILIKTVPTTLATQLLSRFLVFTVAAAVLGGTGAIKAHGQPCAQAASASSRLCMSSSLIKLSRTYPPVPP